MGNLASSARARFELLRSIAFGAITNNFAGVGTPFVNPIRIIRVTNTTDVNILVSFNGIDAIDILPADFFYLYDIGENKADCVGLLELSAGDRIYIKAETALPTVGSVYVTSMYAAQN
jgi:hypothetical protein